MIPKFSSFAEQELREPLREHYTRVSSTETARMDIPVSGELIIYRKLPLEQL